MLAPVQQQKITLQSGQMAHRQGEFNLVIYKLTPPVPLRELQKYDTVAVFTVRTGFGHYAQTLQFEPEGFAQRLLGKGQFIGEGLNNVSSFPRLAVALGILLEQEKAGGRFSTEQSAIISEFTGVVPKDVLLTENGKVFAPAYGGRQVQENIDYITGNDPKTLEVFQRLATIFSKDADAENLFANRLLEMGILGESINILDSIKRPTDTFPGSILNHQWDNYITEINQEWAKRGIIPSAGLAGRGGSERERIIGEARKFQKA